MGFTLEKLKALARRAEGDQLREIVSEALQALPHEPEPNQISRWIKESKGMDVDPIAVGKHVRLLGYRSEQVFRDGRMRRVIRRNP